MSGEQGAGRTRLVVGAVILILLVVVGLVVGLGGNDETRAGEREPSAAVERAERPGFESGSKGGSVSEMSSAAVFGRVRDFEGHAVSGAQICVRRAEVSHLIEQPQCSTSDSEGRYRLEGLTGPRYILYASAPKHQPFDRDLALDRGAELEVDLALLAGAIEVRGVVYDLAGGAVEGAVVRLGGDDVSGDPRGSALVSSDAEGRFSAWVRRGRLHIYAGAEGYATRNVYGSAPGPSLEIYLVPEVVIVGRVVDANTGLGVANVPLTPGKITPGFSMAFTTVGYGWTSSDSEGRFRISGLEPGAYRPQVVSSGEVSVRGEAMQTVLLGLGQTSEPVEIRVHEAASFSAQLVDEAGDPTCTGESVTASPAPFEMINVNVDDEGVAQFSGLRPGEYKVNGVCWGRFVKDIATFRIEAETGVTEAQRWVLERGYTLQGTVVDGEGRPLPRVVVQSKLIPKEDDSRGATARSSRSEPTDKDGRFALHGLEAGRYALEVAGSGGPKLAEPVELELGAPGLDGVRLETAVPGLIKGRVVSRDGGPVANMSVSAYGDGGGWQDTRSGDDGQFELAGLGPDGYRLVALDGRWQVEAGEARVELEAGGQAEAELLVASANGRIEGRVVDDGGTALGDAFISVERQAEPLDKKPPPGKLNYSDGVGRPVLTELDGSFTITGLPEGLYTIFAKQKQGGEAVEIDVEPGARIELVIPALAELSGRVQIEGGGAATDYAVSLSLRDGSFSRREEWRNFDGRFRFEQLPPGQYDVRVSSPLGDTDAEVELAPGASISELNLELRSRVMVRGRVVDEEDGQPIAKAKVRITAPGAEMSGTGHVAFVETGVDGTFSMRVPVGALPLRITPAGRRDARVHTSHRATLEISAEPEQDLGDFALSKRE